MNHLSLASGLMLLLLMCSQGFIQVDGVVALLALIPIIVWLSFSKVEDLLRLNAPPLFSYARISETLKSLNTLEILSLFECKNYILK